MMPSASPKQRVLIVGAKFGEMYLNAFMQPPEGLELVGLLAQGSARSRELAHAFGIPLYTSPEQITRMPVSPVLSCVRPSPEEPVRSLPDTF